MAKKLLILLFLVFNTWALEDRALFSIGDKVFYVSHVNRYIEALNFLNCYEAKKNHLSLVFQEAGDAIPTLRAKKGDYSKIEMSKIESFTSIARMMSFVKPLPKELLSSKKARKCKLAKNFRTQITEIQNANKHLEKISSQKASPYFKEKRPLNTIKFLSKRKFHLEGSIRPINVR
ncbi:hypothetical protein [Bacteriovorax sp. DB6_IX]|uniref:hypothetical protein n=1 Tax=Bacteriovorax sp. DB6_IX TaxID=1353530 RepID=UPI000389DF66|nr:hypothetical protein [Bacteriovorax sp. DB6_IX]EQC50609.1 hypothetical protein M901_1023 [Bacteriovorax sp. DB6_IX]